MAHPSLGEHMEWPRLGNRLRLSYSTLILLGILGLALGLRLYGIGWDSGHGFHPDERSIYMRADCMFDVLTETPGYTGEACFANNPEMEPGIPGPGTFVDADKSPLNPHWFPLGSILIYMLVLVRSLIEPFRDMSTLQDMAYIGRSIAALADVGTVFMVYMLGKRIFSKGAGLLAAGLVALAVVHIQISHFYRPEPLLVFFLMVSFWFMLQVMERSRLRDSVFLGIFVGLTMATKVSVLPLIFPLVLAYGFRVHALSGGRWNVPTNEATRRVTPHALLGGGIALAAFFLVTPYALLDMVQFVNDQIWQAQNVASTAGKVPFTVQYVDTTPLLYEVQQTTLWGLGIPLGIIAWTGLIFTVFKVLKGKPGFKGELLLLAWVVPNILLLATFETKFLRYIFPVVPFLVLMGSGMLFWFLGQAREWSATLLPTVRGASELSWYLRKYAPRMVVGTMVLVVAATAFYAFAFETIYSRPHTAVQASRWINNNLPPGTAILTDNHWDEPLREIRHYDVEQFRSYERDSVAKMDNLAQQLSEAEYLAFYSNRTYGSIARLPDRYPLTSQYYNQLFAGNLGYQLERSFTSYPELLGVAFVDDTFGRANLPEPEELRSFSPAPISLNLGFADENVIDYDHPKVLIFRNEEKLPRATLVRLLTAQPEPAIGLMLTPEQQAAQREGGTFSEIINKDSWANAVPVLAWLLLVEVIYLAALPLATFLFRPLPDRGIILARLLGILGVSYVAWLLASLELMSFSRTSVLVGILAVALASGLVLAARWREFWGFIRSNWRLLVMGETIFLVAFLAFVALRAANPDLWHIARGGEKPMDFAYLNAVLRSSYMPPFDPWFAGGYLNYYYFGQFIVATLIHGTGILPSVAYNLAVPLLFALTVTAAYSLVFNITAGLRLLGLGSQGGGPPPALAAAHPPAFQEPMVPPRSQMDEEDLPDPDLGSSFPWGPVAAGLAAALFVAVIGNLDGIAQVVKGGWTSTFQGAPFPSLDFLSDFWRSSRMIPRTEEISPSALTFWLPELVGNREIGHHITEFPYFSFLFADLHAHMIAIPFTLLALGLAFSLLAGLRKASLGWLIATAAFLGGAIGALWAINSWDYPTYFLLALIMIGTGVFLRRRSTGESTRIFLLLAAVTGAVSVLAFLPFHLSYHPFPTGLEVSRWQTPLLNFLGIHGLFLFLIITFLLYVQKDRLTALFAAIFLRAQTAHGAWGLGQMPVGSISRPVSIPWGLLPGLVGGMVVVYLAAAQYWTAALMAMILLVTLLTIKDILMSRDRSVVYAVFPLSLVVVALLVALGVEFIRVEDDIGRMNTLFKFYIQVWVLLALASAYIVWNLGARGMFRLRGMTPARGVWLSMLVILIASSFIYTALSTRDRLADRFDTSSFTLDGAQFMTTTGHIDRGTGTLIEHIWDYQAIEWLQDEIQGSPVILEAHTDQYQWGSRIADYTGLPTVLGWPWHQTQQRMQYAGAVRDRRADVQEIYSTEDSDAALELLKKYRVEYVVVGQLEQARYPAPGLQKFDDWVHGTYEGTAEVVYENPGIKIYRGLWYN